MTARKKPKTGWFRRWVSEGNDTKLTITGYTYRHGTTYEQDKASAGYQKSLTQTATGRTWRSR